MFFEKTTHILYPKVQLLVHLKRFFFPRCYVKEAQVLCNAAKVRLALDRVRNKWDNASDLERFECFVVGTVTVKVAAEIIKDLIKGLVPVDTVEVL